MLSFIFFFFFFPKKTFVKKKGNVILKLNSCFLFILYYEYIFVLQAKPAKSTTATDNQRTSVLLPTLTMAQHWPSRKGKFSLWLLLRWRLEDTVSRLAPHILAARASSSLSIPLPHLDCPLDSGLAKLNFLFLKNFKNFPLNSGSIFDVLTSEG